MIDRKPIIGVMGSHENPWKDISEPIGRMIAKHDYHLLTGAGGGVMESVARAFTEVKDREGTSIGIVPTVDYNGALLAREEYPNHFIELPILTPLDTKAQGDSMPYSRNHVNIMTSHAIIFLPGSHGTKNEVSLAISFNKPMILFGPEEAFDKFPDAPIRADDINEVKEFLEHTVAKIRTDRGYT
ncbi:MAG: hypothetical protein DHS20C02_05920 [Micavibrio sp.]|nr:MAG: hypothetical protein DHS20C02_05920 [Micavibrio sp.]